MNRFEVLKGKTNFEKGWEEFRARGIKQGYFSTPEQEAQGHWCSDPPEFSMLDIVTLALKEKSDGLD